MKRYLFPIISSLIIGFLMAYFLISSYKNIDTIAVSSNAEEVYYIQRGVYTDKENMQNNMKDFENYIYNVENNVYHTYIGITKSKDIAEKLKSFYKNKGYDTIVDKKIIDNKEFITVIGQYDELLNKTDDEKAIETICNQILKKYEELIKNEY